MIKICGNRSKNVFGLIKFTGVNRMKKSLFSFAVLQYNISLQTKNVGVEKLIPVEYTHKMQ